MFSGQWAVGLVLNQWPQTASGYAPEAYAWALGGLWLAQVLGLAWLWSGQSCSLLPALRYKAARAVMKTIVGLRWRCWLGAA